MEPFEFVSILIFGMGKPAMSLFELDHGLARSELVDCLAGSNVTYRNSKLQWTVVGGSAEFQGLGIFSDEFGSIRRKTFVLMNGYRGGML